MQGCAAILVLMAAWAPLSTHAESADELAKKLSNPVAAMISVPLHTTSISRSGPRTARSTP
jgi:hypothetical protein